MARFDYELDELDRRILRLVQENANLTAEKLNEVVGLSPSAISRRLQRLRDTGVIVKEVAILEPKAFGLDVLVIVDVVIEQERPEIMKAFETWAKSEPAIQQCWMVSGTSDYILVVVLSDLEEYSSFTMRMMTDNPFVKECKASFVLGTPKHGLTIPI